MDEREITLSLTAPYWRCTECKHPGPPSKTYATSIAQPFGADTIYLIPHQKRCSHPNPFNGNIATVTHG